MKQPTESRRDAKPRGVVVPMVTPFSSTGTLDEDATRKIIDFLLEAKVEGVFVLGTTGEAASVPRAARQRLVELTVKHVAGRAPVYAGLNDKDKAFELLNKGFETHSGLSVIRVETTLSNLRDDPRYKDLLKRMDLPE